jgi:hypothetical protein
MDDWIKDICQHKTTNNQSYIIIYYRLPEYISEPFLSVENYTDVFLFQCFLQSLL